MSRMRLLLVGWQNAAQAPAVSFDMILAELRQWDDALVVVPTAADAAPIAAARGFDVVLLDGGIDATEDPVAQSGSAPAAHPVLAAIDLLRQLQPQASVLLSVADSSAALVRDAFRHGVRDVLTVPWTTAELHDSLAQITHAAREERESEALLRQVAGGGRFENLVGGSAPMQRVFQLITQVAETDVDVLIHGETGTGKELVARALHQQSRRAEQPFVAVDCGAIPENLLESELFGHERGAFTGADTRRVGLMEIADTGTLFLDEIGELPLAAQAKLLRVLQERRLRRVGGRQEIAIDVRIVAATARDLEAMIRDRLFREDLYYRIHVVRINLPPLRQRGDDLGLLVEHFSQKYSREMGRQVRGITPEAYSVLAAYHWPGNVRELQNLMRRAIALSRHSLLTTDDFPDEVVASAGATAAVPADLSNLADGGFFPLREAHVARFERDYLQKLLNKHQGNIKAAAVEARIPRGTLYRLLKNHDLDGADFR